MTTDLEDQLTAGMREQAAGITLTTDILAGATRAHRRGTALRRTLYTAGALGLAGTLAAAVAVGVPGSSAPGGGRPPAASSDSPQLRLAAVLLASEQVSYRVKLTVTNGPDGQATVNTEGAFDPATATGYLDAPFPGGVYQQRLVDGVLFDGVADSAGQVSTPWKQEPGTQDKLAYDGNLDGAVGASADPEQLFQALRAKQGTVSQPSAGTYHFTVVARADSSDLGTLTITLVGDVFVGADQRIAKVVYDQTDEGSKRGVAFSDIQRVTLELSDYGIPVSVERPTNVVVVTG